MQFLYPIALFAFSALVIPLLIHLWNVKSGKNIKVGSLLLLGNTTRSKAKIHRVSDWLLYLLRSLLLFLLVLILASPVFEKQMGKSSEAGWLLMERSQVAAAYEQEQQTIDSLVSQGYDLRFFEKGFPPFKLADERADTPLTVGGLSYSSLLKQLNAVLPNDFPVYLYTDFRANRFGNEGLNTGFDLHWKQVKTTDSHQRWLSHGIHQVYEATSGPDGTYYEPVGNPKGTVLRILIHEQSGQNNAKYLDAAGAAIAEFTQSQVVFTSWNPQDPIGESAVDIGFWLSEQEVDEGFLAAVSRGGRVFSYEKGKEMERNSFLHSLGTGAGNERLIEIYRRIELPQYKGEPVWVDGYGDPLLSVEQQETYQRFYFYSKLDPQWTELVWSDQFLDFLWPVLMGRPGSGPAFGYEDHPLDQRLWTLGQEQGLSRKQARTQPSVAKKDVSTSSADAPLWFVAFLVFMLERILTFRKKEVPHG